MNYCSDCGKPIGLRADHVCESATDKAIPLSAEELATPQYFNAYYFSLRATGNPWIDKILQTVARAGKGYHHTEGWADGNHGPSYVQQIQEAADEARAHFQSKPTPPARQLPMGFPDMEDMPDSDALLETLDHIKYEDGNRNCIFRISLVRGLFGELLKLRASPPPPAVEREHHELRSILEADLPPHEQADAILAAGYRKMDRVAIAKWYHQRLSPETDFDKYPDTKEACLAWADALIAGILECKP